jgi:alpha-L-rhamnosidase
MAAIFCDRILLGSSPFLQLDENRGWIDQGIWPATWITHPSRPTAPTQMEFRLKVTVGEERNKFLFHTTADERYELYVDGELCGWGSERGTIDHWYFDSYELSLACGEHWLTARVWAAGHCALRSQMSVQPGFLLAAEALGISTGEAAWEVRLVDGLHYDKPFNHDFFSIGWNTVHDAAKLNVAPISQDWTKASLLHPGSTAGIRNRYGDIHRLVPAILPVARREPFTGGRIRYVSSTVAGSIVGADHLGSEASVWQAWWERGEPVTVSAGQTRRLLIDLEDYVCAWPELNVSGGAGSRVQLLWAESLYEPEENGHKGDRTAIEGKRFIGVGDTVLPDGFSRTFAGPFIRAGRYLQLTIAAGGEPVTITRLRLARSEYPLDRDAEFETDLPSIGSLSEKCWRTVRASCHDNLIDGPYYEQMGWIGDTPQVALTLYSLTRDDRLVRKALETFDRSRLPSGMIRARWPARDSLFIPPYALCWITVLRDFAWWRDDPDFVRSRLPGMRAILDCFLEWVSPADGLLRIPTGWNFVDWVPGWRDGVPPRDADGASAVLQWHFVWALEQAADVEEHFGEVELAIRCRRKAGQIAAAAQVFWNEQRGLYADARFSSSFSEHAQVYAVLSGLVPRVHLACLRRALLHDEALTRVTDPFAHFLFEAYGRLDLRDRIWPRLKRWFDYDALGLLTTTEAPEPSRSDCHAWGAHPHYHLFASLLGLRPASPGFRSVRLDPLWSLLKNVRGRMPHPKGEIRFDLHMSDDGPCGEVVLPPAINGSLVRGDGELALVGGRNVVNTR